MGMNDNAGIEITDYRIDLVIFGHCKTDSESTT